MSSVPLQKSKSVVIFPSHFPPLLPQSPFLLLLPLPFPLLLPPVGHVGTGIGWNGGGVGCGVGTDLGVGRGVGGGGSNDGSAVGGNSSQFLHSTKSSNSSLQLLQQPTLSKYQSRKSSHTSPDVKNSSNDKSSGTAVLQRRRQALRRSTHATQSMYGFSHPNVGGVGDGGFRVGCFVIVPGVGLGVGRPVGGEGVFVGGLGIRVGGLGDRVGIVGGLGSLSAD